MWLKQIEGKYNNRVYVRGHKYVLGPTQTHFSPSRWARAKQSEQSEQSREYVFTS